MRVIQKIKAEGWFLTGVAYLTAVYMFFASYSANVENMVSS
jgi:hypothetical protein